MGKHRKSKRVRPSVPRTGYEVAQIFFGAGAVPLTPERIDRLVGRGWPRADLERFARLGALYSVPRDSIVFPAGAQL